MTASFKPVAEQLAHLKKGVAEIIREEELRARLEKSFKTGKPLKVKAGFEESEAGVEEDEDLDDGDRKKKDDDEDDDEDDEEDDEED